MLSNGDIRLAVQIPSFGDIFYIILTDRSIIMFRLKEKNNSILICLVKMSHMKIMSQNCHYKIQKKKDSTFNP